MNKPLWKYSMALAVAVACGSSGLGAGFSTNLFENGVLWNYGYEGGTYPTNGFGGPNKWLEDPQAGPPPDGSVTVTAEGLTIDTGASGNGMGFRLSGPSTVLPATNVWTVEFRMRLLTGAANSTAGGVEFRTGAEPAGFSVRSAQTVVQLRGAGGASTNYIVTVGTDWHTYRVVSFGGTSTLYMDTNNTAVLSIASATNVNQQIEFGDYGSLITSGSAEYDYVRWTFGQAIGGAPIPEPSALALLGLAGCGILWCNRRR